MRLVWVALLCAGCSLVNSTSDLRDLDAGSTDARLGEGMGTDGMGTDGIGSDVDPEDVGTDVPIDGFDVGPPPCPPQVANFEVIDPSNPPIFEVEFTQPRSASCTDPIAITVLDEALTVLIVVDGPMGFTFTYQGALVPLIDPRDQQRLRDFSFNGVPYGPIPMPVERMRTSADVYDFTYDEVPAIDVSNNGDVVFTSNDEVALGSIVDRVYLWRPNGEIDPVDVGVAGNRTKLVNPKISDDGCLVAYAGADSGVYIRELCTPPYGGRELVGIMLSEHRHLDLRSHIMNEDLTFLLAHGGPDGNSVYLLTGGETGYEQQRLEEESQAGPGLLDPWGPGYGYSAQRSGQPIYVRPEGIQVFDAQGCTESEENTLFRTRQSDGLSAFAAACRGGVLQLPDDTFTPTDVLNGAWGLANASDQLSVILLRNGPGDEREVGYAIVVPGVVPSVVNLILDGQGGEAVTEVADNFNGAAISPNGEWAAYAISSIDSAGIGTMQVFRTRVSSPRTR